MFWKKTINALCLSFIVMSLMGCGSSANLINQITEAEENSSAEVTDKGSRNNPYKIGDIITLNDISPVCGWTIMKVHTNLKAVVIITGIKLFPCIWKML